MNKTLVLLLAILICGNAFAEGECTVEIQNKAVKLAQKRSNRPNTCAAGDLELADPSTPARLGGIAGSVMVSCQQNVSKISVIKEFFTYAYDGTYAPSSDNKTDDCSDVVSTVKLVRPHQLNKKN